MPVACGSTSRAIARTDAAEPFSSGVARIWDVATKGYGLIDARGEPVTRSDLSHIGEFVDGLAAAARPGRAGFLTPAGAFAFTWSSTTDSVFSEGLARVPHEAGYGYVDATGALIIPGPFEDGREFSEGLAAVRVDGRRWGYIDRAGSLVIVQRFTDTTPFVDGLAMVHHRGEWCYVDTTGRIVMADVYRPSAR